MTLARPHKARLEIGFFRNTGIAPVALTLLAGAIAVGMTLKW